MFDKPQEQNNNHSTAFQIGNINTENLEIKVNQEITYQVNIFSQNSPSLNGKANEIILERARDVTSYFYFVLSERNPDAIDDVKDNPALRYALLAVQHEYARNGDKDTVTYSLNY